MNILVGMGEFSDWIESPLDAHAVVSILPICGSTDSWTFIFLSVKEYGAPSRENLSPVFPTRLDANRPVEVQRLDRVLKFWI